MLYLLNLFEGEEATPNALSWLAPVVLGVFAVAFILMSVISQRKQKKKNNEMLAALDIGSIVTTIGGVVGEVVRLDDDHIWISTGVDENKTTIKFLRQAIHHIAPAPGTPEAIEQEKVEKKEANEEDEIK